MYTKRKSEAEIKMSLKLIWSEQLIVDSLVILVTNYVFVNELSNSLVTLAYEPFDLFVHMKTFK